MSDPLVNWRNRLACWMSNAVLRWVATEQYRMWIGGSIAYGLQSAVKDERAGHCEVCGRG